MEEINENKGAEIIDFQEILNAAVASAKHHTNQEESASALLLDLLNIISDQMQTERVLNEKTGIPARETFDPALNLVPTKD